MLHLSRQQSKTTSAVVICQQKKSLRILYPQAPHKRAEIMTLLFHGILHHNYINPPIYVWCSPGQWKWTSSKSPNGHLWIKIWDYQMLMKCIFTLFWRHSLLERERCITKETFNLLMHELKTLLGTHKYIFANGQIEWGGWIDKRHWCFDRCMCKGMQL